MELTILIFSSNTLNGWKPCTKSTCFTQWFLRDHTDPIIRIWLSNLFDSKDTYIIIRQVEIDLKELPDLF